MLSSAVYHISTSLIRPLWRYMYVTSWNLICMVTAYLQNRSTKIPSAIFDIHHNWPTIGFLHYIVLFLYRLNFRPLKSDRKVQIFTHILIIQPSGSSAPLESALGSFCLSLRTCYHWVPKWQYISSCVTSSNENVLLHAKFSFIYFTLESDFRVILWYYRSCNLAHDSRAFQHPL